LKSKTINRIGFISNNALRQTFVSAFGMATPFLVISFSSKVVWGSFVSLWLFTLFATQVINWGNKEYVLRQFSLAPNKMKSRYSEILFSRLPLVFIFAGIAFFWYPITYGFWLFLWLFGRYLYHSVEALIVYDKKFNSAIAIELGSFVAFLLPLYFFQQRIELPFLILLFSLYQLARGVAYFLLFYKYLAFPNFRIDFLYFKSALPFFLLSILGFLASKVDVYLVNHVSNRVMTSEYQIINSLLVFIMSVSAFIYAPFTKNIYRNNQNVVLKTQKTLALIGLVLVPVALVLMHFVLFYFVNINGSFLFYAVAFFYVYPSYVYGIDVVLLFKSHQEKKVVLYLTVGAFANSLLSALFLYLGYGITGALVGSAAAQVFVLILFRYHYFEK